MTQTITYRTTVPLPNYPLEETQSQSTRHPSASAGLIELYAGRGSPAWQEAVEEAVVLEEAVRTDGPATVLDEDLLARRKIS